MARERLDTKGSESKHSREALTHHPRIGMARRNVHLSTCARQQLATTNDGEPDKADSGWE